MSSEKRTDNGIRLCDQDGCDKAATHTLVWTDAWKCYCLAHANKVLLVADALSHPTPKATLRQMTINEIVSDDDGDT